MRPTSTGAISVATLGMACLLATPVLAVPTLQLDIVGGHYDEATETIVAPPGQELVLVALLTPKPSDDLAALLGETYFISAALLGAGEEGGSLGSFTFQPDGEAAETVDATDDMAFGAPPREPLQEFDAKDLSKHGIFETYFSEHPFMFDMTKEAATYNTQDDPGGDLDLDGSGSFYRLFTLDTSLLSAGVNLHFDLYSSRLVGDPSLLADDVDLVDRDRFAPFSHDAETDREDMPEPATLLLLGAGLTGIAVARRRNR